MYSQQNIQLVGALNNGAILNDIWGYVAPDGVEYALVGRRDGLGIVSLSDPSNPEQVVFFPGGNSVWRDVKTWENFAYVVADQPGTDEGLVVIDLSPLPDTAYLMNYYRPEIGDFGDTLNTCHNLFIDEFGIAYLAGCNPIDGLTLMFDLTVDPIEPPFLGPAESFYSHDVYARNNLLYTSNIYESAFGVVDVSDKENPVLLAQQETPFGFTHNTWLSDNGNTIFTTDERANAPVAAYGIGDLSDIILLDEFRPPATLGQGVIPHNVHVINDFIVVSYYTDGCIIVDAARPRNLVQVGKYDDSELPIGGFSGAWGAYPYLPSGLILVSDIRDGLQVLEADYKRACYLEGLVRDIVTTAPINNVSIEILSDEPNTAHSDLGGRFYTGQVTSGTFTVRLEKAGYESAEIEVELINGIVTTLAIEMQPLPEYVLAGNVSIVEENGSIAEAKVILENKWVRYETLTDEAGNFEFPAIFKYDDYILKWGKWGFQSSAISPLNIVDDQFIALGLESGYADNFELDLGWTISGPATKGAWLRDIPVEIIALEGYVTNPGEDSPNDWGELCYLTGNRTGAPYKDELDGGQTILTSPVMDLSKYNHPQLQFEHWFVNIEQESRPPNDSLSIYLSNGTDRALIFYSDSSNFEWQDPIQLSLLGFMPLTDQMRIEFIASDFPESSNLVEAAIDNISITERVSDEDYALQDDWASLLAIPNPFQHQVQIEYKIDGQGGNYKYEIINSLGQLVKTGLLDQAVGSFTLDTSQYPAGVYFIRLLADNETSKALKILRY